MNKWLFVGAMLALCVSGCSNLTTRYVGGEMVVNLPKGKKLVNATWKDGDLWYLVRDIKIDETPEIIEFIEKSTLGVAEGKVVFKEVK